MDPIDQALAGYIPGCVRLRTLTLGHVVDYSVLATAVRKNGSLHSCGVGAFNDELRRIGVYCERNKRLPELLVEHRQNVSNEASDFASFPPFFAVARHAPRTAPNALLSGLLTTNISISGKATPERGVKRAADSPSNRRTKKRRKATDKSN
jgi:hypothetical protein